MLEFNYSIVLKTNDQNKHFSEYVVTRNGFALNHAESLQINFFYIKSQAKTKYVEKRVVQI